MLKVTTVGLSLSKLCAIASCFLPLVNAAIAEDIGASLSDGKPLSMVTEDGKSGQLTLVPGGKGKMKGGPMGMAFNVKWREQGKLFCIKPGPLSERCMNMQAAEGGYDGFVDGKKFVSLRR
jgi:hypothetical protein